MIIEVTQDLATSRQPFCVVWLVCQNVLNIIIAPLTCRRVGIQQIEQQTFDTQFDDLDASINSQ